MELKFQLSEVNDRNAHWSSSHSSVFLKQTNFRREFGGKDAARRPFYALKAPLEATLALFIALRSNGKTFLLPWQ